MLRAFSIVLILAGCATPEPPKPLTAMEVYQRIRESIMSAPAIGLAGTVGDWVITATLTGGNRTRITVSSWDSVVITNGTQSASFRGAMPSLGPVASNYERTLRAELLRGLPPGSSRNYHRYIQENGRMIGIRAGNWSEFTEIADAAIRVESTSAAALSFMAVRPRSELSLRYPVTIRFDRSTYAPLSIESSLIYPGEKSIDVRIDLRLEENAPDHLFVLPEDPQIRINRAKAELSALKDALDLYAIDNHAYPTTEQGLEALRREPDPKPRNWKGPYTGESTPSVDPWDRPYFYRSPRRGINPRGYDLSSWGWDGKPDTWDDLR